METTINNLHVIPIEPFGIKITPKNKFGLNQIPKQFILDLLAQHKLILFRGFDEMTKEQLVVFAKRLGNLLEWDFGNVMEMKVDTNANNYLFTPSKVPFHWDGAFHLEPNYLLFHCIQAPLKYCGGETLFSNSEYVYAQAEEVKKTQWKELSFIYETEKLAHYGGQVTVPLIQKHPLFGNHILRFAEPVPNHYLNPVSVRIENEKLDNNHLIGDLSRRFYDQVVCYSHEWENNDYLIADNFSLLHARNEFKSFSPRHLRRIQLLRGKEKNDTIITA